MPDIFDNLTPDQVADGGDIFDSVAPELTGDRISKALASQGPRAFQPSQYSSGAGMLVAPADNPDWDFTKATVGAADAGAKKIGTVLHDVGSGIYEGGVAALQHNIEDLTGLPADTAEQPGLTTEQAIRKYPKPVQAGIQGVKGVVESAPQLGLAMVHPALGVAAFGLTPEGFDPKQAALAAALPVIGKWSGAIVETMAAKAGVTADQALLAWNKLGGATGAAGAIGADQAIAISQLPPEQREQAWIDAAGNVGSMFILGTLSEHKRPNVERIVEPNRQRAAFVENLPGEGKPVNVEATVKPVATESRPTAAPKDIFDEVSPEPILQSQAPESSQNSGLKAGNKNTPAAVSATSPDAGASSPAGSPKLVSGALQAAQATDAPPTVPKTTDEHILQATESLAKAAADLQAAIRGNQLAPQETKPAVSEANLETLKGGESNGQEIQRQRQGQEVLADRPSGETVTAAGGQPTLPPDSQPKPVGTIVEPSAGMRYQKQAEGVWVRLGFDDRPSGRVTAQQADQFETLPGSVGSRSSTAVLPDNEARTATAAQRTAPANVGTVAQQSQEFDRLVKDYGPQAGWATGDEGVYNNQLQTGENLASGIAAKVQASRQMQALRRAALSHAVPPDQRNNYDLETPEGRAKALPVLEAHLRQQFPADNTIAKRRALQQFGSSEPQALTPSQQRAGLKQDGDELRRIAAENPGGAEFRNLVVHSTAGRGASAGSPGQLGGNGGRKSRITAAEQKALRELDRIHGTRTIIVDSPGELPFNGFKDRNSNVILIHARADKPVLVVAGHELLHHIRLTNPALYEETAAQLWPLLQNTGDFRLRLERRGQGKADAVEELLADFVGDNFGRKEFWDDLRKREPNLFRRLAKMVKEWLDKLIAKLKGEKPKTFESEQYFSDLEQARNVVTNALIQAGRETQYRKAGIATDLTTEGTEARSEEFSKPDGGDLFGAPETVEEQRARLKAEAETQKLKKAKEQMQDRAAARLVSTEDTRTQDMFGTPEHRTTRMTSEGQGSLFSKPEKQFPERFALAHPIKGQNGAAIVGYEWRSTMGEKYSAREGGMVDARVSDWDNADESTGTGRAIVHVFYVQHPNGTVKPEGIRSAQNVLGISETRLMTIAKKERAAQQYREDQERAEMDNYQKAAVTTPQEAARNYRKWNYSPMRTFEQNDEIFNESALFEKAGKFIRRSWKTAARMQRNGWTLVKDDPARTGGTIKAIDAIRPPESEKKSGGGLPQEITDAVNEWRGAEKRYRRARRQEPTDVGDAEEARQEAEINFRVLAEKHNITQAQFDDLIAEAKATDTEQMGDLEQGSLFSKPERETGPLWRSNMLDALESWQNKGTPEQLRAHLAKTKGAMDEAEWIGLDDFLKDKPSVTKQQVQEFVKANTVDVQEVEKRDSTQNSALDSGQLWDGAREALQKLDYLGFDSAQEAGRAVREDANWRQNFDVTEEEAAPIQAWKDARKARSENLPKFEKYQLPGGENYRELLLTLPGSKPEPKRDLTPAEKSEYETLANYEDTGALDEVKQTRLDNLRALRQGKPQAQFKSSHFDEPNILAHVRFNERTDAAGKRVLFIEEVQSDWHQKGRKEGYDGSKETVYEIDVAGNKRGVFSTKTEAETRAVELRRDYPKHDVSVNEVIRANAAAVPNAPFKQTWPMLAMKRMIRYASEHGFDRIAWTTGEQQAERYDLSKQIGSVTYNPANKTLKAYKPGETEGAYNGGLAFEKTGVEPDEIVDYIGKEPAEKLINAIPQSNGIQRIAGLDLKVGGEGMKGFYDKILPGEVNKFVKKWGGRVGRAEIPAERPQPPDDLGEGLDPYEAQAVRDEWRMENEASTGARGGKYQVHSLDITPAMKDAAMQGMPLFSKPDKSIAELQVELKQAEGEMMAAIRTAGSPTKGMSNADAKQAVALATAKYREIEDAINQHPDRFKDKSVADLNARLDEIQTRLTEIEGQRKGSPLDTGKYEATGAKAADHQELISERWRLLKDRKAIDKAIVTRPEYAADVLKRSEALANDLRAAKARGDTTAARQAVEDLMALQEGELARIDPKLIEQVRADLVAKGELEALTPASARTLGDLTAWLKANKIESPGMSIKDRLNLAGRLAAEWTQGKTKLEAALAKSRAIWQAFKAQWRSPKTDDEVRSIFKEWHYEKQFSGLETHQWIQRIRADIPQKIRRNAISVWLDADGDKGLLTFQRDAVPEQYRAVWQTALNLTPSEQAFARQIKADFASKLADGQLLGLIGKGRQYYGVPQVWAKPPEHGENYRPDPTAPRSARNPLAKLDPRDPFFALERTHDSYFDGIMAGGVPKSLDISDLVGVYNVDFHGALADRSVIKALKDAKMPDGSPAVMMSGGAKIEVNATGRTQFVDSNWRPKDAVTEDGRPYQTIDHWALRSWTFGAKDTAGNPIMVKGDFLVHPDLYRDLKTQLEGKSALRDPDGPLGDIAHLTKFMLESGAYLKASKFAAATFHGATLAEHMMTHAFSGKPSPERLGLLNPWVGGVEIDPAKNVELANLMRHGMDLGFGGSRMLFEEGLSSHGGILSKVPGLGDGLAWLSNGLFQEYLPRLKVKMGSVLLHANLARYSKKSASGPALTEQQIYELTASQVNAAFGGQNWKLMGRSKTFLDVNRLLFTAPDFLLSRAKVVGQAGKPYHAEQRYFLLAQAALVYAAARILNYLLDDGDPHWEAENALRVIHKGRAYSARFIVNDIGHLLQDPAGFAGGRLGPWPKALYETVTGRDMRSGARIEVPFKTENGALNAAQILIKDLAMWGLPIGTEGFLPGATGREQTTLGQFGVGLLGVGSQRYTPETEMYQLAAEFNRKSPDPKTQLHQQTRDDAVKETSVYRKLDVLLEAGDFKAARKEYDALLAEGHTVIGIKQRYNATTGDHLARPFSGSVEREKKFKASLTPEQLQEYNRAVELRKRREKAFQAMLSAEKTK